MSARPPRRCARYHPPPRDRHRGGADPARGGPSRERSIARTRVHARDPTRLEGTHPSPSRWSAWWGLVPGVGLGLALSARLVDGLEEVIARPRCHSSSNVASPTCARSSSRFGAGSGQPTSNVRPSRARGAAPRGRTAGSRRRLPVRGREPGRHLQRVRKSRTGGRSRARSRALPRAVCAPSRLAGLERKEREVERACEMPKASSRLRWIGEALLEQRPGAGLIAPLHREPRERHWPGADAADISQRACAG